MRLRIAFLVIALLFSVCPLAAGQDSCLHRILPVNALTEKGFRYASLTAADLKASLHGKPVKIVSVQPNDVPPRVMIVLDASGSMLADNRNWTLNLSVARALIQYLPTDSLIGLAVFAKTVKAHISPTPDRGRLAAELDRIAAYHTVPPRGEHGTALWDALNSVITDFDSPRVGDSIFVITDGHDNESSSRFPDLKRAVLTRSIRIFTSDFWRRDGGLSPRESEAESQMRDLVESSGGYAVGLQEPLQIPASGISLKGTSDAEILLQLQARQLVAYYQVEVELPARLDKPQTWKMQAKSPKVGDLIVFYPRELMPCSASETAANVK